MKRKGLFQKSQGVNTLMAHPLVEIMGDQRVLIERHKGVLGYNNQRICVKLSFGTVMVTGCNLEIMQMSSTQLVITGRIMEISYRRGNN